MPPTIHARLSASSAHRWMNCPGSIRMSEGIEDPETIYQIEGRAAHTYAEQTLRGEKLLDHVWVETKDGPREFPVDDTMREAVGLYVDTVHDLLARVGGRLYIERTFDLGILRPPEPMFGTADAVIVGDRVIDVVDLKYGAGVTVEVTDNVQLLYYALGAILAEFTRRVMDPEDSLALGDGESVLEAATNLFDEVRVTIVQPRAPHTDGPVRQSLTFTGADIKAFAEKLLARAKNVQAPDAALFAGSWCQFCPARGHCPELAAHAKLVAQTDFESVPMEAPPDIEHMPIERVAAILQNVEVLNIFIAGLRQRITRELEAGREVPGWKLVNKRAQRQWLSEEMVQEWADGNDLPGESIYEKKLLSPAQLEKIIGKAALPEELYARVSNGTTLVPDTDPRPAAAVGPAADFAALPPGDVDATS
jgi:Protein of unknown function (DUF2800)